MGKDKTNAAAELAGEVQTDLEHFKNDAIAILVDLPSVQFHAGLAAIKALTAAAEKLALASVGKYVATKKKSQGTGGG